MRTRIKICGVTRPEDARVAAVAGADAVGLVFYPHSPRALDLVAAEAVAAVLPPFVSRVALFLDPAVADVQAVIDTLCPDLLQFHGEESPEFCGCFGVPYMKAVPMGDEDSDPAVYAERFADACALLLDGHRAGQAGGRGEGFAWERRGGAHAMRIVLAGGLTPDNVAAAIRNLRPYAVDVSSGVESAPGVKDAERIRAFAAAVYATDRER
jgi:phosphoribosylanthranilate isomerase